MLSPANITSSSPLMGEVPQNGGVGARRRRIQTPARAFTIPAGAFRAAPYPSQRFALPHLSHQGKGGVSSFLPGRVFAPKEDC